MVLSFRSINVWTVLNFDVEIIHEKVIFCYWICFLLWSAEKDKCLEIWIFDSHWLLITAAKIMLKFKCTPSFFSMNTFVDTGKLWFHRRTTWWTDCSTTGDKICSTFWLENFGKDVKFRYIFLINMNRNVLRMVNYGNRSANAKWKTNKCWCKMIFTALKPLTNKSCRR